MRKCFLFLVVFLAFGLSYKVLADEVAQKTDSSFVGQNPKTISSSFMGDDSGSVINDSFMGEDIGKSTDQSFVGAAEPSGNNLFSGEDYHRQVRSSTQVPFAEDNSNIQSDRAFIGEDTKQKTDSSFVGDDYGR